MTSTLTKEKTQTESRHTISVLLNHNLNAMARVLGIFSGKGFEIDSISFGPGEHPERARVTLTTMGDEQVIEQIIKQLNKVIDVVTVKDLTYDPFVERELAIIKVSADASSRTDIMQVSEAFRAKVIDISLERLSIEVTGKKEKIDAAISMMRPFGIEEIARTGCVALTKEFNGSL